MTKTPTRPSKKGKKGSHDKQQQQQEQERLVVKKGPSSIKKKKHVTTNGSNSLSVIVLPKTLKNPKKTKKHPHARSPQQMPNDSVFGAIRKQMGPSVSFPKQQQQQQQQSLRRKSTTNTTTPKKKAKPQKYNIKHQINSLDRSKKNQKRVFFPKKSHVKPRALDQIIWWKLSKQTTITTTTATTDSSNNPTTPRQQQQHSLLTDHFPEDMMTLLDQEMIAFSSYVRLNPIEMAAREHVIQHVTDLAGTVFGTDAQVQCFGSFATPEVATFASDVDMAVWGVVPVLVDVFDTNNDREDAGTIKTNTTPATANKRESRISKWRHALMELDQSNEEKEVSALGVEDESIPAKAKPPVPPNDMKKGRKRSDSTSSLFVLDRDGAVELGADEEEIDALIGRAEGNVFQVDRSEEDEDDRDISGKQRSQSPIDLCNESDSDDDSADKLESLSKQTPNGIAHRSLKTSDSDEDRKFFLSSSDGLEVSFVTNTRASNSKKLDGETRQLVINSLRTLGRALWRSPVMTRVEVRHRAKVPIVTTDTKLGFEADVAVGGHNGADTSQFAASQVAKYQSFGPVVLLLKIILAQQDLDKPFTGGLGSFKLYVLVSHHLERHLSLGGNDRPSEVLLSFFGRFGNTKNTPLKCHEQCFTWLGTNAPDVTCKDGSADLKSVFKIDDCVDLFGHAWDLLVETIADGDTSRSMLADVVDAGRLKLERERRLTQAALLRDFEKKRNSHIRFNDPNKSSLGRRVNHIFERLVRPNAVSQPPPSEASEEVLMAGYGVTKGPLGCLLPMFQPGVKARKFHDKLMGRAGKNRSAKRKQKRDVVQRELSSQNV